MMVLLFCVISLIFSLISFAVFRIEGAIPRYLSVTDLLTLAQAVILGELLTSIVLFTFTRLDGVPRSVPAIHALILGAGLLAARGVVCLADRRRDLPDRSRPASRENLILIGLNDLAVLLIKFIDAQRPSRFRVVGLLDPDPRWIDRWVQGVRVLGPPSHLGALVEEFAIHGVCTDRVLVSSQSDQLLERELAEIRRVCADRDIDLTSVEHLLGSGLAERRPARSRVAIVQARDYRAPAPMHPSSYFRWKGRIEAVEALGLMIALSPLWLLAAALAFFDLGSPILFWQQRAGLHGRDFQLYKVRTLRSAFDRQGQKTPKEQRLSWIGRLLRRTRRDELPQLLNVLVGDMSLVGPRPLLPQDQPPNPSVRLMVRPGITGWAQVNGGNLLSPEEKEELDAWYVRNASFWLDFRIIAMTLRSFLRGDRRSESVFAEARADRAAADGARLAAARHEPPELAVAD
jgi:lipopolysaccharide/colanic/teichoic acid biosynthesis glycosyltransferase